MLWVCANQTVSLNSPGVVYFACLSGRSYLSPGEKSVAGGQCSWAIVRTHRGGVFVELPAKNSTRKIAGEECPRDLDVLLCMETNTSSNKTKVSAEYIWLR